MYRMVCISIRIKRSALWSDDFTYSEANKLIFCMHWCDIYRIIPFTESVKWLIMQILHHSTCDWFRRECIRCNQNAIPLIKMLNLEIFAKGIFSFKNWMFDSLSKIKSKYQSHFALFNIPPLNNFLLTRKSISWKKIFAIDNAYHFTRSFCVIFDENRIDRDRDRVSEREKTACFAFDFINVRLNDFVQFK